MDQYSIDVFFMTKAKYFPAEKTAYLRDRLNRMDEEKFAVVSSMEFKNPTAVLLISVFLGFFGVDRFLIGDIGVGFLKLCTGGCFGILTVVDWFVISGKTKAINFDSILAIL